jgi:hypothetical protein
MIWLFVGALGGMAVVAVAGWARGQHRKVEAENRARRVRSRLQQEEAQLLARLRDKQD